MLLYLFFSLFVLMVIKLNKPRNAKYRLPPSPFKLPFIGNLHQVCGSTHHALQSLARKHGGLMFLHLGSLPAVVVSTAEVAREVMKTHDHAFCSRPNLLFARRLSYAKDIAFIAHGDYWREVRKISVAKFLNAKKIRSFRPIREEETALMMEKIMDCYRSGSVVNLTEIFVSFTINTLCRVAFGRTSIHGEQEWESVRNFKKILNEFTYLLGAPNIAEMIPSLAWINHFNGLNARVEKNFSEKDVFLDGVIQQHIDKKRDGGDEEEEDIVDVLLGIEKSSTIGVTMGRDGTKGILLDMFAGGTDTTSVAIEWAMSELIMNPEIMQEVQKEVREIAGGKQFLQETDIHEMQYLQLVIKETLRLHPPFPINPRGTTEKAVINGYDIPANTRVMINTFAIQRDPMWWDEPEKFWPKRFLNGKNTSVDVKGQDFQLIPFGSGRRVCPGLQFAMGIIELVLANLLNRFDWELPEAVSIDSLDMCEAPGMMAYKKKELVVTAKARY